MDRRGRRWGAARGRFGVARAPELALRSRKNLMTICAARMPARPKNARRAANDTSPSVRCQGPTLNESLTADLVEATQPTAPRKPHAPGPNLGPSSKPDCARQPATQKRPLWATGPRGRKGDAPTSPPRVRNARTGRRAPAPSRSGDRPDRPPANPPARPTARPTARPPIRRPTAGPTAWPSGQVIGSLSGRTDGLSPKRLG